VPTLLILGVDFHLASATSLFIITAATLSALFVFVRSRLIDYKLALILEPTTCVGAFVGGLSSESLGDLPLSLMFSGALFGIAFVMHRNASLSSFFSTVKPGRWTWQREFGSYRYNIDLRVAISVALVVGYFGGMLGFAGGIVKVPMMVVLFGMPIKVAIATSSLMVTITSVAGCIGHAVSGDFDLGLSLSLAAAGMIGAHIGARLTLRTEKTLLKQLFAIVLFVVAIWMLVRVL
jgi:uncharacterized membrane protein YfcA